MIFKTPEPRRCLVFPPVPLDQVSEQKGLTVYSATLANNANLCQMPLCHLKDLTAQRPKFSDSCFKDKIQGALNDFPLDVSNDMDQSDGNIKLWSLSPN
ncbi:hypothetical protein DSO57_1010405 [Entomophthora muscae]|uniref:Uncharacterized protein n=1 Tax=Entomophthora muscae TaxID=34485 RepID=A0ACC2RLC0_9FUNG|nr:hypothetical protein DSO57_1010405 [Entomophthora muscae]